MCLPSYPVFVCGSESCDVSPQLPCVCVCVVVSHVMCLPSYPVCVCVVVSHVMCLPSYPVCVCVVVSHAMCLPSYPVCVCGSESCDVSPQLPCMCVW